MKQPDKKIIEIADFLFTNTDKKMSEVLSYFVGKYRKTDRTIERYIKQAKEYNLTRQNKIEQVKEKKIIEQAEKEITLIFSTKQKLLEKVEAEISELDKLKIGQQISIKDEKGKVIEKIILDFSTLIRLKSVLKGYIEELAKMQGYYAPTKNENTFIGVADPFKQMRLNNDIDTKAESSI